MTAVLAAVQLFLIAGIAFAGAVALVVGLGARSGARRLGAIRPAERLELLSALAASPVTVAVVGVLACTLPSIVGLATHAGDHCDHHDGHPHLCPWHLPEHGSTFGWLLLGALGAWILVRVGQQLVHLARGASLVSELEQRGARAGGVVVLDSPAVFAATVGLFAPTVIVTRALRERLPPAELRAVLAHEHAHARRRDALRLTLARLLWSAVPSWLGAPLLAELAVACEEICDREAADAVGDPLVVADAIVEASRGARDARIPHLTTAMGFGACATDRRVRRLLDPAITASPFGRGAALALAALVLALAEPLHHATETFLGLLLH